MGISVGGLASGIDTASIISQLQAVEAKPIATIQQKESDYQVQLSAYSTLKSNLSSFQSAAQDLKGLDNVNNYSATSSNTSLLSVSVGTGAIAGNYSVTINALASAQKLKSGAFSQSEAVGEGTLHLAVGTNTPVDIAVGATDTISDVAASINSADAGVKASVIFDGVSSYYLTLTGKETGKANAFSMTVTEAGTTPTNTDGSGLSRLVYDETNNIKNLSLNQAAVDAQITMDGIDITRSSNIISDAIKGVTLNLNAFDTTKPSVTVAVNQDNSLLSKRINAFVTAYNSLADTLNNLQSYDASTHTAGTLFGDFTVRSIQSQIQSVINNPISGLPTGANLLSDMGITISNSDQKKPVGKMQFDQTVLDKKIQDNFSAVSKFFTSTTTGSEGFSAKLLTSMQNILTTGTGTLSSRTDGIQSTITSLQKQVDDMNARLADNETRLKTQFNSLELILAQYKTTSDYMTQQISQWNSTKSSS